MSEVYINKIDKYFPNNPVSNDEMELRLGLINENASKSRRLILRNNGITNRYYAIDKEGNITHSNAKVASLAVKSLFDKDFQLQDIELLTA